MCKDFSRLNQFLGRKCEITFNSTNIATSLSAAYVFQSFYYEINDEYISLKDNMESECDTTIELDNITDITNLGEDIWTDVVSIYASDLIISVSLLEAKPTYPRCFKCSKEIKTPEASVWNINGIANYGSYYDGNDNALKNLVFCDDCVYNFVGEVGERND